MNGGSASSLWDKATLCPNPRNSLGRGADLLSRGPDMLKTFGELRRMESLGEWRFSGVLLHLPFVKRAIPEKLVPQSELICRRLFAWVVIKTG